MEPWHDRVDCFDSAGGTTCYCDEDYSIKFPQKVDYDTACTELIDICPTVYHEDEPSVCKGSWEPDPYEAGCWLERDCSQEQTVLEQKATISIFESGDCEPSDNEWECHCGYENVVKHFTGSESEACRSTRDYCLGK